MANTRTINVRMTEQDAAHIDALADQLNIERSEAVRLAIRSANPTRLLNTLEEELKRRRKNLDRVSSMLGVENDSGT